MKHLHCLTFSLCIALLLPSFSYGQSPEVKDSFMYQGLEITLSQTSNIETPEGLCEYWNTLTVREGDAVLFEASFCTVEDIDAKMVHKGYLTVIEHYSSPVGWSQFYVVDVVARKVFKTHPLQESMGLPWEQFIDPKAAFLAENVASQSSF